MGEHTEIAWCHSTFNPWIGCQRVAPGCEHCYAESFAKRTGKAKWGPQGTRVKTSEANWRKPLKWNREAEKAGERRRVFCASLADVFEDWTGPVHDHHGIQLCRCHGCGKLTHFNGHCETPRDDDEWSDMCGRVPRATTLDDIRIDLFRLIDSTPWLDWLLLTKRPENIRKMWSPTKWGGRCAAFPNCTHPDCSSGRCRSNVWLGTSISTQDDAEQSLPHLLQCGDLAPVLFASLEPLLEAVDLTAVQAPASVQKSPNGGLKYNALALDDDEHFYRPPAKLSLVIVGGESGGHRARPMHPQWALDLRDQCKANDTAFFFKQWGQHAPYEVWQAENGVDAECQFWLHEDGRIDTGDMRPHGSWQLMASIGKSRAGRLLDGRVHDEMPEVGG